MRKLCWAAYADGLLTDGGAIGSRDMPESFGCSVRRRSAIACGGERAETRRGHMLAVFISSDQSQKQSLNLRM
jgi:hypothetical protein